MTIRVTISVIFVLVQLISNGQILLPIKTFHKHIQTCHYVGTTEEDFFIVLYSDSTIQATKYTTAYYDQYGTILKLVYSGRYEHLGDTIKAIFSSHNSEIKSRTKKPSNYANWINYANRINILAQYPTSTYVLIENKIVSDNDFFPPLSRCAVVDSIQLDSKFRAWDKDLVHKREIFGVPCK